MTPLCGRGMLDVLVSLAASPLAGVRRPVNNRDYRHEVRFLHEKDQVWEAIDLREAYRRDINREHLWMFRNLVKPSIDVSAKTIRQSW